MPTGTSGDGGATDGAIVLGKAAFSILSKMSVFGTSHTDSQLADAGTQFAALKDGLPIFARYPLAGGVPGYVDLALRPSLGDPVVAFVQGITWDPAGFEAQAEDHGYTWRRWVSYSTGEVALDCGGILLDPNRSNAETLYVVPVVEAEKPWGLSPEQRAANETRYDRIAAVIRSGQTPGASVTHQALPLCPVSTPGQRCVPQIQQKDKWCVPASLAMGIEYWLGPPKPEELQYDLADSLNLLSGSGFKDVYKVPQAVSVATHGNVACVIRNFDWIGVTTAIDMQLPTAYIGPNHTVLVYGYTAASTSPVEPAFLWWVDPSGANAMKSAAFSSLPLGNIAILKLATAQPTLLERLKLGLYDRLRTLWQRLSFGRRNDAADSGQGI